MYIKVFYNIQKQKFISFRSETVPDPLRFRFGRLYLGGLPEDFNPYSEGAASTAPFIGCLGDGTVNGHFINFANVSDSLYANLGTCDAEGAISGSATDHPMGLYNFQSHLKY